MSRAAKLAAAVIRPINYALRPIRARWDKYWDVDHRAVNFYTDEEWEVVREQRRQAWEEYHKQKCAAAAVAPKTNSFVVQTPLSLHRPTQSYHMFEQTSCLG